MFVAAAQALATLLGFMAHAFWALELFSHFRLQYGLGLFACGLLAFLLRSRKSGAVWILCALVNLGLVAPYFVKRNVEPVGGRKAVSGMLFNVNTHYGDPDAVALLIAEVDPDLLVLEEVNSEWMQRLLPALGRYAYREEVPREDNFGIALYSKSALSNVTVLRSPGFELPSICATLALDGGWVQLIATHPPPPKGPWMAEARNRQFKDLAMLAQARSPTLLVGDLNLTPWSPYFSEILKDSGLHDSMRGFGLQASWPTRNMFLRIPIDHVLVSDGIVVTDRRLGRHAGSDHFPVLFSFVLAE